MPKKRSTSQKLPRPTRDPKTVRELRTRLEKLGNPWNVHTSLSDDDPLPQPSRGGELEKQKRQDTFANSKEMRAALEANPPTNPFLQQVWIETGWMKRRDAHGISGSTNEPPTAPDSTTGQQPAAAIRKGRRKS